MLFIIFKNKNKTDKKKNKYLIAMMNEMDRRELGIHENETKK